MRVLIVDDHPLFRDGIVSLLEAAKFEIVGQAGNGQEAVEAAQKYNPDLVLLDIKMPVMDGLQALQLIKTQNPQTQVVMLTVSDEDEDLIQAIKAGANGYLLKNLNASQFLEMLKGLKLGEAAITRKTTARLISRLAAIAPEADEPKVRLTRRELEVLGWVAEGLSNLAIAQKMSVTENTVKYHMRNILQKMKAQNRTEAVAYAIQLGLLGPDSMHQKQ